MKHLNPRQGITTLVLLPSAEDVFQSVKHLNPRQGITTDNRRLAAAHCLTDGVKHLNPRQGITTHQARARYLRPRQLACETPKSPPGDYNTST